MMDRRNRKKIKEHNPNKALSTFLVVILLLIVGYNVDRFTGVREAVIDESEIVINRFFWSPEKD